MHWLHAPLIYLPRGNDSIRKVIGVDQSTTRVALIDFFDSQGNYKLSEALERASKKTNPSLFEKDFLKAHENYYLLNLALSGRSEEHTSELQSRGHLVCRLLIE